MTIYTIGFTKKSAEDFFELLKQHRVELMIDIRLNNKSQLAGFSKGSDLRYFLREICGANYVHCPEYAPTKELLSAYQAGNTSWSEYERVFDQLMESRKDYLSFLQKYSRFSRVCLLCSEPTPERCHRRLVAEKIAATDPSVEIIHL